MKARITILLACCLLTCHVRTFGVNVDVEFVDASSASGDKYVSRNVDDDDKNEQWDKDQNEGQMLTEQPAEPEDDLKKFKVTTSIENGTLSISVDASHTSNVRFWADEKKEKLHKKSWAVTGGNIINAQDAPAHSDGTEGYFWVEGLVNSASLNDIEIKAKIGDEEDPVKISVIEVDLDVDSKNEHAFDTSGFDTDAVDKIEMSDETTDPGKIVIFSPSANSDADQGDQVPDFADGFKLKSPSEFASCANLKFVPLRVDLKTPFDPQNAKVSFHYEKMSKPKLDGDDAGLSVSGTGTSENPYVFTVLKGGMRLWNKKATERTSGNTVADDGNFIPVDEEIEWSKIEESSGSRTGWVYLEYMDKDTPEYSGKKEIKVTAKQTVGGTLQTSDTVNVCLLPVEVESLDRYVEVGVSADSISNLGGMQQVAIRFESADGNEVHGLASGALSDALIHGSEAEMLSDTEIASYQNGLDPKSYNDTAQDCAIWMEGTTLKIATVFNQAGPIKIRLMSGINVVASIDYTLTALPDFSELIDVLDTTLAEIPFQSQPPVLAMNSMGDQMAPMNILGGLLRRNLVTKCMRSVYTTVKQHVVDGVAKVTPAAVEALKIAAIGGQGFVQGLWAGVKDDWSGLVNGIQLFGSMITNPVETSASFARGFKELLGLSFEQFSQIPQTLVKQFFDQATQDIAWAGPPNNLDLTIYTVAYTTGFITEKVGLAIITAGGSVAAQGVLQGANFAVKFTAIISKIRRAERLLNAVSVVTDKVKAVSAMKAKTFRKLTQYVEDKTQVAVVRQYLEIRMRPCTP
jgi:hypothetical protein